MFYSICYAELPCSAYMSCPNNSCFIYEYFLEGDMKFLLLLFKISFRKLINLYRKYMQMLKKNEPMQNKVKLSFLPTPELITSSHGRSNSIPSLIF